MRTTTLLPRQWNWGAFFLTWIWGLGNRTYLGFTVFLVFIALATLKAIVINYFSLLNHAPFHLALDLLSYGYLLVIHLCHGLYGTQWSWTHKAWSSGRRFQVVQRIWAWLGLCCWLFFFILLTLLWRSVTHSAVFHQSLSIAKMSPVLQAQIGSPIQVFYGSVRGGLHNGGLSGRAFYKFTAQGSKGVAQVIVVAVKEGGQWRINDERAIVPHDGQANTELLLYPS